jgi:hypothetical protein
MNLNDFEEKFTEADDADIDGIPIVRSEIEPDEIKSYIADKLREFGERVKKDIEEGFDGEELLYGKWKKIRAQIEKELSELQ